MTLELKPLLDLYATTVFLYCKPVPFRQFAIITACNPNGEILAEQTNKKLNISLSQQITQYEYVEIIGASPDLSHQEPSFAIAMELAKAQALAKRLQQNAIFWVQDDEVFIVPAGLHFQQVAIGSFKQKCRLSSNCSFIHSIT